MPRHFTSAETREIRRLYCEELLSTAEVARRVGRTQGGVHAYLVEVGLNRSRSEANRLRYAHRAARAPRRSPRRSRQANGV